MVVELRASRVEEEGPLQVSKWLHLPVLLDADEMAALLDHLGKPFIYNASSVLRRGEGEISVEAFLSTYRAYVSGLKQRLLPDPSSYRAPFSALITSTRSILYRVELDGGERHLIKATRPVIQLQPHTFAYSPIDGAFRSMVRGEGVVTWGIQFSYPQIFQDPKTLKIEKIDERFPNTELFKKLQRWMRHQTRPTRFEVEGKQVNVPIRLGKQCLDWIAHHPQLQATKVAL
jgi:hypothetical protein